MKIIIAGSSGFIGSALRAFFEKKGDNLILLSRHAKEHEHYWDPDLKHICPTALEDSDVAINLCGESIFGRWTKQKKEKIRSSRLMATEFLTDNLLKLKNPPKVYIGASAVGYYGDTREKRCTENCPPGNNFLAQLCKTWEAIPEKLATRDVRVVLTRFGVVLGKEGGMFKKVGPLFKAGIGGKLGSGEQMMSWIDIDDLVLILAHLIERKDLTGAFNTTSPNPITNEKFTKTIGHVLGRPTFFRIPKFLIKVMLKEGAEAILANQNSYPQRLLDSGYMFKFPDLEGALKKVFAN